MSYPVKIMIKGKICGGNHILGGNMETSSKNVFRSFQKKLKLGTTIVLTNMYSHAKVEIQFFFQKIHMKMKIFRFMCTRRQNSWILSFSAHEPYIFI